MVRPTIPTFGASLCSCNSHASGCSPAPYLIQGFNVEDIEYNNITMTVLDPGGQEAIRPIWHHCTYILSADNAFIFIYIPDFSSTQAMIFVVDSSDRSRINETRDAFHWILDDILPGTLNEENLRNFLILVYANKQDLPNAMTTSEIAYKLRLHSLRAGSWCIQVHKVDNFPFVLTLMLECRRHVRCLERVWMKVWIG